MVKNEDGFTLTSKKLIIPFVGGVFSLVLVSCIPTIPDISAPIEEINRIEEELELKEVEIEELETKLENEKQSAYE